MKKIKLLEILAIFLTYIQGAKSELSLTAKALESKLAELKISLPKLSSPVANFVSHKLAGKLLYISGQLPWKEDKIEIKGQLGKEVSLEKGQEAAKICAVYILAQLHDTLNQHNLKLKQCVKINGYVSATADFHDHPKVINGASDLLVQVLGDEGKHARAAVGVSSLPLGAAVEVEAIFEVE